SASSKVPKGSRSSWSSGWERTLARGEAGTRRLRHPAPARPAPAPDGAPRARVEALQQGRPPGPGQVAAVDHDLGAGDVAGLVAREKEHEGGDLVRLPHAGNGLHGHQPVEAGLDVRGRALGHGAVDVAGVHRVDPYAER